MKRFNLSLCAMLSVIAVAFTSCLDDGDNTSYVSGMGTVQTSNSICLDNGLYLETTSLNLTMGDRVYIYGSVDGDAYETAVSNLNAGMTARIALQSVYQAGVCEVGTYESLDNADEALEEAESSAVTDISWLGFGSFGNGYMNFSIKANWFTYTQNNTEKIVPLTLRLYKKGYNPATKKLELVLLYENGKSLCYDENGKLRDGYKQVVGYEIPVSIDVTSLYYELQQSGLSADTDEIDLSVQFVTNEAASGTAKELSEAGSALNGQYGSKNYFTLSMLKRIYR